MDKIGARKISLTKKNVSFLPQSIGVYLFKHSGAILYIGKSVSLRARILSHLENAKLDPKENAIVKNSDVLEYYLADSEFKALLLESSLIQKYHPKYNRRWQDDKSYLYIKITLKEKYPKVLVVRKEDEGKSLYFGPFQSRYDVDVILKIIRKIFPFCTQKKLAKRECFYAKIGLCNPCPNSIEQMTDVKLKRELLKQYRYSIRRVIMVLSGKIDLVLKESYRKIKDLTKQQNYEEALLLRDKILNFERLIQQREFASDISSNYNQASQAGKSLLSLLSQFFPNLNKLNRIECYDISSLLQKDATASMVVFSAGMPNKSEYRKFRIKNMKSRSDFAMLEEVFKRRFKHNWQTPDLIVVDGGTPQVLRVKRVFHEFGRKIPLIGLAKHPDRLIIAAPDKFYTFRPQTYNLGFILIRALRDEAHRFARKYHLLLRRKKMLQ